MGLGIILLELLGLGGYFLTQQSQNFIETAVLIIMVGGVNLVAVVMILVGLFRD